MRTPTQVRELTCIATCEGITQREWDNYMGGTTKADGTSVYRCGAPTSKGAPCRNKVRQAGARCHHHQ
jgi:hypothetical protein